MIDQDTGEIIGELPRAINMPFIRSPYNYDRERASDESGLACLDESRTQQQFKEESDINNILERFGITGELPNDVKAPQSGDFTAVTDFHSALNVVRAAEEAFMEMPANVRKRFGNDPGEFMAFIHDPANIEESRKLGLRMPEKVAVATQDPRQGELPGVPAPSPAPAGKTPPSGG